MTLDEKLSDIGKRIAARVLDAGDTRFLLKAITVVLARVEKEFCACEIDDHLGVTQVCLSCAIKMDLARVAGGKP